MEDARWVLPQVDAPFPRDMTAFPSGNGIGLLCWESMILNSTSHNRNLSGNCTCFQPGIV